MKTPTNTQFKNYLEGNANEEELNQISQWIKQSGANARHLFLLEELYEEGKRNPEAEQKQTWKAEAHLFKCINAQSNAWSRMRPLFKYAAIIAGIILISYTALYWLNPGTIGQEMLTASTGNANITQVQLPDGTKVWLNHASTLTYPRTFSKHQRRVSLEGEAYFEVAKNPRKPFVVNSREMQIKVLGTTFNLKATPGCRLVEASLIEGSVEVRGLHDEGMITLSPGQKAELSTATRRLQVKQVDTRMDAVWHDGLIPFEKADIFTIIHTLERFYNLRIILSPDFKSDKTYSGVIKKKDHIDDVLHSLHNVIPFSYRISGDTLFILPQ